MSDDRITFTEEWGPGYLRTKVGDEPAVTRPVPQRIGRVPFYFREQERVTMAAKRSLLTGD